MKQILYSAMMLMLGMTASQNVSAATEGAEETTIYSTVFNNKAAVDEWTVEGKMKDQSDFKTFENNSMQINGYIATEMTTEYVYSPVITLGEGENVVDFNHMTFSYWSQPASELNNLCVRTVGGEWVELEGVQFPETEFSEFNSGKISVPAEFNGQDVQFGFKYQFDGAANCGYWYIKTFEVVCKESASASEPYEIFSEAFDSQEAVKTWVVEGSQKDQDDFTMYNDQSMQINGYIATGVDETNYVVSPVIKLDNNFNTVTFDHKPLYFFGDPASELTSLCVRTVGGEWVEIEGVIYTDDNNFYNAGVLDIPEQFNGKEVEFGFHYIYDNVKNFGYWYVRNFKVMGNTGVPTMIENVENAEINDNKIYDLQGRMVENPAKGLYIVNGKKVIIK